MSRHSLPLPFPHVPSAPPLADGTVPIPPTPLLGRDRELREVAALLDRDDLRLVTLVGPGGVGKTRLAVETAAELERVFADGAIMVPLESIRDASLVPEAIAREFGIRPSPEKAIDALLVGHLVDRHLLLVLDNLEQVIDAAAWLASTLARCRRLRILATSRRPLGIAGEQQYRVEPLPVPADADPQTAAVALFVERSCAIDPAFDPDVKTIATIAEICRRLDGLPLAIELAAARTSVLSPEAVLARLTHRLSLLTSGHPEAPARLRSMRDAIGWSHELLAPEAQRLFHRLSVFLGGFTLEAVGFAAAWPGTAGSEIEALSALQPLLDQSLVQPMRQEGEPRFRMLETIREYGIQAASGHDAERMHAEYYLALTEPAERALTGPDQVAWLNRLESEYPNLRQATIWLATNDRLDDAIELVIRIVFFLNIRGHVVEALQWLEDWLERPDLAGASRSRGLALGMYGTLLQSSADLPRSSEALAESASILHRAGDPWHEAMFIGIRAATHAMMGDIDGMRRYAEAALTRARAVGFHRSASADLGFLADYAELAGDPAGARRMREEAWREARESGDVWLDAFRHGYLGDEALAAGRLDEAEAHTQQALQCFAALDSLRDMSGAWGMLGWIAARRGDLVLAGERLAAGLQIANRAGQTQVATQLWLMEALVATERRDLARAATSLSRSLREVDPGQEVVHACRCLNAYAQLAARAGDVDRALGFHAAATQAARRAGLDPHRLPFDLAGEWLRSRLQSALGKAELSAAEARDAPTVEAAVADALAYTPTPPARPQAIPSFGLSPRETEVLRLMADGLSNQQISDALYVSLRTTATHVTNILTKLRLPSRTAAVAFAIRNGLA